MQHPNNGKGIDLARDFDLAGRVAIVTGGSRGIGRATALRLGELGATVIINYHRDRTAAEAVVSELRQMGARAEALQADVANLAAAEALIKGTLEFFRTIDILVCNAGIWQGAPVEEISEELWDRTMAINLKGTWSVCRAAVPIMKRNRSGRIVIVSSTAGQRGEAGVSNYAASKGGQISFTKSLSTELAEFDITVNCVAPGWVDTDMNDDVFADGERRQSIIRTIPLKRVATADDIAAPIAFLCTDWARHITGEVLNVNGGSVLCG